MIFEITRIRQVGNSLLWGNSLLSGIRSTSPEFGEFVTRIEAGADPSG
jgi:hypothetical protein